VRSPPLSRAEIIFSPALLPSKLMKPRTVCFCQPVSFRISDRLTALARRSSAITSAFLLPSRGCLVALAFLDLGELAFFAP